MRAALDLRRNQPQNARQLILGRVFESCLRP